MGQLRSTCTAPAELAVHKVADGFLLVAARVEFERHIHILKPGLIFKGKGLKPAAFKLMDQQSSPRTAPPPRPSRTSRRGTARGVASSAHKLTHLKPAKGLATRKSSYFRFQGLSHHLPGAFKRYGCGVCVGLQKLPAIQYRERNGQLDSFHLFVESPTADEGAGVVAEEPLAQRHGAPRGQGAGAHIMHLLHQVMGFRGGGHARSHRRCCATGSALRDRESKSQLFGFFLDVRSFKTTSRARACVA
jgi:hypothetical protein